MCIHDTHCKKPLMLPPPLNHVLCNVALGCLPSRCRANVSLLALRLPWKWSESVSRWAVSNSLGPWTVATRLLCPWDSQARILEWGALLQGISLIQGSNPCLLHCRWILHHLRPQGSPADSYFKRMQQCIGMQGISVCWFYILQLYYNHWLVLVIFWWSL